MVVAWLLLALLTGAVHACPTDGGIRDDGEEWQDGRFLLSCFRNRNQWFVEAVGCYSRTGVLINMDDTLKESRAYYRCASSGELGAQLFEYFGGSRKFFSTPGKEGYTSIWSSCSPSSSDANFYRILNEEWTEGSFVRKCVKELFQLRPRARTVACLDSSSRRVQNGSEWRIKGRSFIVRCSITINGEGSADVVACVDPNGKRKENGETWTTADESFVQECVLENGSGFVRTTACKDETGTLRLNGSEWLSSDLRFFDTCFIYPDETEDEGGKIVPTACANALGERVPPGETWKTADGDFMEKCVQPEPDQIFIDTHGCVNHPVAEVVSNGSETFDSNGLFIYRCLIDPVTYIGYREGLACVSPQGKRQEFGSRWKWMDRGYPLVAECLQDPEISFRYIGCFTDSGREVEDGDTWESLDGHYKHRCNIDSRRASVSTSCVKDDGGLADNGDEWTSADGKFVRRCLIDSDWHRREILTIACVENGQTVNVSDCKLQPPKNKCFDQLFREVNVDTKWRWGTLLLQCQLSGSGRAAPVPIACLDLEGRETEAAWFSADEQFRMSCLLNERRVLVECVGDDGTVIGNGGEWASLNGFYWKRCEVAVDGGFRSSVVGCVTDAGELVAGGRDWEPTPGSGEFKTCSIDRFGRGIIRFL